MGEGADGVPGNHGEHNGEHEQQEKSETPEFALASLELLEALGNRGTVASGRGPLGRVGGAFLDLAHEFFVAAQSANVWTLANIVGTLLTSQQHKQSGEVPYGYLCIAHKTKTAPPRSLRSAGIRFSGKVPRRGLRFA